jgi:carboxypeptidase Taq
MVEKIKKLKEKLHEISDYKAVIALLEWDQQVNMPPKGAEGRALVLSRIYEQTHNLMVSDETLKLLEQAEVEVKGMDPDSDEARLVKVNRQQMDRELKVPASWVNEFALTTAVAHNVWEQAKANNDFPVFQPNLQKIVELRQQYAEFFKPYNHIYDPLLHHFDQGLDTKDVLEIFSELRPRQVELIRYIAGQPQVNDKFLHGSFSEKDQWDFGVEVITAFGYDWSRGRLDKAVHPFTIDFNLNDVRITTRVFENLATSSLFSCMHEAGHALYGMGADPAIARTPLTIEYSMALHESQSRMWENLVGRSLPFWKHYYPKFQERFRSQLGNVSMMDFYKAINKVEPSYIRVEADEATYNLHVMLRFEIELALIENRLEVKDLPEYWNSKFKEYFGITPPDNARGVLQDVHWSSGYIGYFPTYSIGNVVSVQLWEAARKDIPNLDSLVEKAEFKPLLDWLVENVHRHAAKFPCQELVQRVTGSKIDPQPYLNYLENKYKSIYTAS